MKRIQIHKTKLKKYFDKGYIDCPEFVVLKVEEDQYVTVRSANSLSKRVRTDKVVIEEEEPKNYIEAKLRKYMP